LARIKRVTVSGAFQTVTERATGSDAFTFYIDTTSRVSSSPCALLKREREERERKKERKNEERKRKKERKKERGERKRRKRRKKRTGRDRVRQIVKYCHRK
jgi:DNA invertase Pin-like site-specific DNA recombinase